MSKLPVLSVAVGALFFGVSVPAQAATGAQIVISNSTQTNATCPVTLHLTGIVTGQPNVPFEYWLENARNGVRETTAKVAALMPPTGVAPIGGSITIGESTDAAKENHVQVQVADVGQRTPALSNVATFSITCRSRYVPRSGAVTADSRPAPGSSRAPVTADPVNVSQPTPLTLGAGRLRAAGLDPAAPDFARLLETRLDAWRKATSVAKTISGGVRARSALRISPVAHPELFTRKTTATRSSAVTTAIGSGTSARGVSPAGALTAASNTTLTPHNLYDYMHQTVVDPSMTIAWPAFYALQLHSNDTTLPEGSATMTFSVPQCGIYASFDANFFRSDSEASPRRQFNYPSDPNTYYATFMLLADERSFALGAQPREATFGLSTRTSKGGIANMEPQTLRVAEVADSGGASSVLSASVDAASPFLLQNSLGMTAANTSFDQTTTTRINTSHAFSLRGSDTLGIGMQLGPGYTATASVVSAHSVSDLGGDSSPDNQYRGAAVTMQPAANRLQTVVSWHIGPGDSLQYVVQWTFSGPAGQRPLMTLPLTGPCDS